MMRAATTVPSDSTISTTVCVIGSGPAGLTVASRLAGSGVPVLVLESGEPEHDPAIQELSQVRQSATPLINLQANRFRQVGGNSNAWVVKLADGRFGVRYAPLDPVDFEARPAMEHSGWPLTFEQLRPHYEAAQEICEAGPFAYGPEPWAGTTDGPWSLDQALVDSKVFQFGPRDAFYGRVVERLSADRNATILHGATAVELVSADSSAPVQAVRCRRLDGTEFRVEAERFVLAMGGLGNPHLLLASNSTHPAGLGNHHDLVGRFLMDHPLLDGGSLVLFDRSTWSRSTFYDLRLVDGHSALGYLALSGAAIEEHDLRGLSAVLFPRPSERRSRGLALYKELVEAARTRSFGRHHVASIPRALLSADYLAIAAYRKLRYHQSLYHGFGRGGWSEMPHLDDKFARWEIVHQAEQSPDPENRVTLTRERDAVGMPVLDVHWSWSEGDAKRAAHGRRLIAEALRRGGIGQVTLPDDDDLPGAGRAAGTAHHMGTTRMHADPRHGVVDADAKVHGVANVWVAGSSLFPTSGYANPTLTIVALADRLGRHLTS